MLTLALFGTSADPPTAGHQQILRQLSYQYDQVIAWASDNPMKTDQTPLGHRAAMLQLLINDIDPPRPNLKCRQDLSHSRTLHTIERVQTEWPESDLTLVVGSDLIQQLPRWYQVRSILAQVKLLVVPRPNYAIGAESIERLQELGAAVAIANFQGLPVSSTAYRQARQKQALTAPIHAYIMRERLYDHR
ncbi:MAG: nicotinate-nucleotide adenylyltransferase [Cyanobacteria bacterium P01_F01_bin.150]